MNWSPIPFSSCKVLRRPSRSVAARLPFAWCRLFLQKRLRPRHRLRLCRTGRSGRCCTAVSSRLCGWFRRPSFMPRRRAIVRRWSRRLETAEAFPYMPLRQRAGRPRRGLVPGEESPGSMELRCRVTPGGGSLASGRRPFRDSATERTPPAFGRVRSKGCGKSAPRARQRVRHGKPHRVQDRIGAANGPGSGSSPGLVA